MRLLLVEDHVPLADEVMAGLTRQGYAVDRPALKDAPFVPATHPAFGERETVFYDLIFSVEVISIALVFEIAIVNSSLGGNIEEIDSFLIFRKKLEVKPRNVVMLFMVCHANNKYAKGGGLYSAGLGMPREQYS